MKYSIHGIELDVSSGWGSYWNSDIPEYGVVEQANGNVMVTLPMGTASEPTFQAALIEATAYQRAAISGQWVYVKGKRYPLDTAMQRLHAAGALQREGIGKARVSPDLKRDFYSDGLFGYEK